MTETQRCENCGVEVGEEAKRVFTFYKGLRLCLSCYETLQPHPIVKVDEVRIPSVRLSSKFDDETASQFSESIAEHGILIPIHIFKDESGNFWLADGLHRLNHLKSMGRKFAPAVVKEGSEVDAAVASARLNILRGRANLAELAKLVTF
jgi:ParB-like chromosome segregation protein Spo0J